MASNNKISGGIGFCGLMFVLLAVAIFVALRANP
jgi:hypothetical protein